MNLTKTLKALLTTAILSLSFLSIYFSMGIVFGDMQKTITKLNYFWSGAGEDAVIMVGVLYILIIFLLLSLYLGYKRIIKNNLSWKWLLGYFFIASFVLYFLSIVISIILEYWAYESRGGSPEFGGIFFVLTLIFGLPASFSVVLFFGTLPQIIYKKIFYSKHRDKYKKALNIFKILIYILITFFLISAIYCKLTCSENCLGRGAARICEE